MKIDPLILKRSKAYKTAVSVTAVVVGLTVCAAACGESIQKKEENLEKCGGFSGAFFFGGKFTDSVNSAFDKSGQGSLLLNMLAWQRSEKQYEAQHTTGQSRRMGEQGGDAFRAFANKNDYDGAIAYINHCVSDFNDISKHYDW